MKDRNKQERSIPRHKDEKKRSDREGFSGSSRTGRTENVQPDRSQGSEPRGNRNRDLE